MTTTPQAALLSAQNPLLKRCYTMSESHLSGYRVVIGFERLEDAQDAHEYIAKLQATQEPVQAGELPDGLALVVEKLERFQECAEDSDAGGCDIGREWFDALTTIGLLRRTQRSPGLWEMTSSGSAVLARAALSARKPLTGLTREQMDAGRHQVFSTNNPFCPCDSKTFRKVAEWTEREFCRINGLEVKP